MALTKGLGFALALAACSTIPDAPLFAPGHEFHDDNADVYAIVAHNPSDGYIYFYPNRATQPNTLISIIDPAQGGLNYSKFVRAIGGLGVGEVKRVPRHDGYCTLGDDLAIRCISSPDGIMHTEDTVNPASSAYEARRKAMGLTGPGDGVLLRDGVPLPRKGV